MLFLNATNLISETADFHQMFHYNKRLYYYEMKENCLFCIMISGLKWCSFLVNWHFLQLGGRGYPLITLA